LARAPFAPAIVPDAVATSTVAAVRSWNTREPKDFSAITDGLSSTIAISETVTSASNNPRGAGVTRGPIRSGVVVSAGSFHSANQDGTATANPRANCLEHRDSANPYFYRSTPTLLTSFEVRGARIDWGYIQYSGFCTVLPPNSPSCAVNGGLGATETDGFGLPSASSNHTGGVNVGMLDGAVRFVTENIDCGNTARAPQSVSGGASNHGVWGSLGSINGGEASSL